MADLVIGQVYWTPFDPGGPVELVQIDKSLHFGRQTVTVRYVEDHPHGYKRGAIGRYYADELRAKPEGDPNDRGLSEVTIPSQCGGAKANSAVVHDRAQ